jgi:hypothetical protein
MQRPNPELVDQENPEWTDEDFAKAVPLSGLPEELQSLLSQAKQNREKAAPRSTRQPAA